MNSKLEDFDLDGAMEDVSGDVTSIQQDGGSQVPKNKQEVQNAFEDIDPAKQEWREVIKRLEDHCDKTWICIPSEEDPSQFIVKELNDCTGQLFMKWVEYLWPTTVGKHSPADYERTDIRQKCFNSIFALVQSMKMRHGLSEDMPKKSKKKSKKEK